MAFGQTSGPPATRRQLDELLALVNRAGYDDFREARHPLGFTQRQSNGKFTRDEADAFIAELTGTAATGDPPGTKPDSPGNRRGPAPVSAAERTAAARARELRNVPAEALAAELQRRGWAVMEP